MARAFFAHPLPHPLPGWHPFYGSARNPNRLDHHLNSTRRGSGREQGGIGIASLCRGRQRRLELPFTRCAPPGSNTEGGGGRVVRHLEVDFQRGGAYSISSL